MQTPSCRAARHLVQAPVAGVQHADAQARGAPVLGEAVEQVHVGVHQLLRVLCGTICITAGLGRRGFGRSRGGGGLPGPPLGGLGDSGPRLPPRHTRRPFLLSDLRLIIAVALRIVSAAAGRHGGGNALGP